MERKIKPAFFFDRTIVRFMAIVYSLLARKPYKVIEIVERGRISHRAVPNYQRISGSA